MTSGEITSGEITDAHSATTHADTGGAEWRTWPAALIAAGGALVLYALLPLIAFRGDWGLVNYDDPYLVASENPAIGKGLIGGLHDLLMPGSDLFMDAWLPVYYWSLGLDHALFGDWWMGWHLHSALLHALGAALVVFIAREAGRTSRVQWGRAAATTAGLVFALHPVATESVAWIASRKDQLSFVWAAGATLCYLHGIRRKSPRLHALGALFLAIGLAAKGTVLVLPFLFAVHALFLRDDTDPDEALKPIIPYAAVAFVMTALHYSIARFVSGAAATGTGASFFSLLVADLAVAWMYMRTLFLPLPMWASVEHAVDPFGVAGGALVLGAATLIAWCGATLTAWRRSRPATAFLLAIPLALAPFNNVFPQTSVLFAERYAYVAVLPLALGVGAYLASRLGRGAPFVAAALLGALAAPRIGVWQDSVTLWRDAAAAAPASALVRMQLADAYVERATKDPEHAADWYVLAEAEWRGARVGAAEDLRRAQAGGSGRPFARAVRKVQADSGLATFLLVTVGDHTDARSRAEEAVFLLDEALVGLDGLEDASRYVDRLQVVLTNRAAALEALGRNDDALAAWKEAGQRLPKLAQPLNAEARLYLIAGRGSEAAAALAQSAQRQPDDPTAARERAEIRAAIGDTSGAKRELLVALAAHPDDVELLLGSARLDLLLLRPVSAEKNFEKALALRPDDAAIRRGLASALVQQAQAFASRDDAAGAREAARKAAEVAPESSAPAQILGIVARRTGGLDEAVRHFREAFALQPDGPRIREAYASVLVERAAEYFEADRDGPALRSMEEAVGIGADRITTPKSRVEDGVAGWPPLEPDADNREVVARQAALRGLAYLAMGRADDALVELRVAAAGTRSGAPALRRVTLELLKRAALLTGDADTALKAVEELPDLAAELDDFDAEDALEQVASAWMDVGMKLRGASGAEAAEPAFARAREELDRARDAGLSEARVHQHLGEILFAEESFLDATREFDRATELAPEDPEPYLNRAALWRAHYLMEEDGAYLDGAEKDLRKALAVAPSDARVMAALGDVMLMSHRPSEAFPWLQRAVLADPSQLMARALLAELLVRAGRSNLEKFAETRVDAALDEAESAARRAMALDPPSPEPTLLLAAAQRARGDWADALRNIIRAREEFPERQEPRDALAGCYNDAAHGYLLNRQDDAAIRAFRQALAVEGAELDPKAVEERLIGIAMGAFKDGIDASKDGRAAAAVTFFRRSLRADETPEGWFQLAWALLESGAGPEGTDEGSELAALKAAEEAYAKAISLRPEYQGARLNRAGVLMRLGRPGDAALEYRAWMQRAAEDDGTRRAVERQIEIAERLEREISDVLDRDAESGAVDPDPETEPE